MHHNSTSDLARCDCCAKRSEPCDACRASDEHVQRAFAHDTIERPYRCESCDGRGYRVEREWTDGLVERVSRSCDRCKSHGALTTLDARVALADAARMELQYGLRSYDSTRIDAYLAQAQAIGDEWMLGFWARILDRVARIEQERARRAA